MGCGAKTPKAHPARIHTTPQPARPQPGQTPAPTVSRATRPRYTSTPAGARYPIIPSRPAARRHLYGSPAAMLTGRESLARLIGRRRRSPLPASLAAVLSPSSLPPSASLAQVEVKPRRPGPRGTRRGLTSLRFRPGRRCGRLGRSGWGDVWRKWRRRRGRGVGGLPRLRRLDPRVGLLHQHSPRSVPEPHACPEYLRC